MGYVILERDDTLQLMAEVNRHIADGWVPLGGVACYFDAPNRCARYAQALVREPERRTTAIRSASPSQQIRSGSPPM
jgi:hypothetical protein